MDTQVWVVAIAEGGRESEPTLCSPRSMVAHALANQPIGTVQTVNGWKYRRIEAPKER